MVSYAAVLTRPLIHAQKPNARTARPRGYLTHIVHQSLQPRVALLLVVLVQLYHHAQVLGQLLQAGHVARNEFRRAVVVFQQRDELRVREAEGAAEAEEDAEDQGDQVVDAEVEERLYGAGFAGGFLGAAGRRGVRSDAGRGGQEGFEEFFALLDGELFAAEGGLFGGREACGSHCGGYGEVRAANCLFCEWLRRLDRRKREREGKCTLSARHGWELKEVGSISRLRLVLWRFRALADPSKPGAQHAWTRAQPCAAIARILRILS